MGGKDGFGAEYQLGQLQTPMTYLLLTLFFYFISFVSFVCVGNAFNEVKVIGKLEIADICDFSHLVGQRKKNSNLKKVQEFYNG